MTSVAVLGSTGSIGTQTLEVVDATPGRFEVVALSAKHSMAALVDQALRYRPKLVVVDQPSDVAAVVGALPGGIEVGVGEAGLIAACELAEVTVNAIVGFAGLPVTMATLAAGRRLALANKESLIAAAPLVHPLRATPGAELVPVDSEHCAIFQCLGAAHGTQRRLERLVITASGGPFRGRSAASLASVSRDEALAHPTWAMGPKISIDSSTLMNKGLEVIEAHALFDVDYDAIDVVVHPQSIVHSMVEFTDGTTLAQLSQPDMRLPIGYALGYPDRLEVPFGHLSMLEAFTLSFEPPDRAAFPCLNLAYAAGRAGGVAPAWLSGANEVAVAAFLDGQIDWIDIAAVVAATMDQCGAEPLEALSQLSEADRTARDVAHRVVLR